MLPCSCAGIATVARGGWPPVGPDVALGLRWLARRHAVGGTATGRATGSSFWAHPAFANRHVVPRNDEEIIRVSLDEADYR